jgi:hypothetical protein
MPGQTLFPIVTDTFKVSGGLSTSRAAIKSAIDS